MEANYTISNEYKQLLINARNKSEKAAGPAYKDVKALRKKRDELIKSYDIERKKPGYEEKLAIYEKKANKGAFTHSDTVDTISEVIRWIILTPVILGTIAVVIVAIISIINTLRGWGDMDPLNQVFWVIAMIIFLPIVASGLALANAIARLIAGLLGIAIWEVYSFFSKRKSKRNIKKYNRMHIRGYYQANWKYQAKLYEHNSEYPQNEVIRCPEKQMSDDCLKNNQDAWIIYKNDCLFSDTKK